MSVEIPPGYKEVEAVPTNWGSCLEIELEWPEDEPPITGATLTAVDCKPPQLSNMTFAVTGPRTAIGELAAEHARLMPIGRSSYFRVQVVRPDAACPSTLDRIRIEVT